MSALADRPSWSNAFVARAGRIYGLRLVVRYGAQRFLRDAALVSYFVCLLWVITAVKPDLIDPTHIGTDTSNYYAAGLRLNADHPLYAQGPGDRPVPIEPPFFVVPLLSPPFIAVAWRVLALLPGSAAMYAWWLGGLVTLTVTVVWMTVHGSSLRNGVILLLAPWLALTAWSGNVNCYLAPMLALSWYLSERGHGGTSGALIAVAAAVKITPILYLPWLLVRRDRSALLGFVGAAAACAAVSLAGAGFQAHLDYLAVMRDTGTTGVTPLSVPGILIGAGVPPSMATFAIPAFTLLAIGAIVQLRRHPDLAFSAATLASVFAAPSMGYHSLPLLLPAVAPYPARGTDAPERPPAPGPASPP